MLKLLDSYILFLNLVFEIYILLGDLFVLLRKFYQFLVQIVLVFLATRSNQGFISLIIYDFLEVVYL